MRYRPVIRPRSIILDAERAPLWRTNAISQEDSYFAGRAFSNAHADFRARTRIALRRDMSHGDSPVFRRSEARMLDSDKAWEFVPAGLRWFIVCATVFWYSNTFL